MSLHNISLGRGDKSFGVFAFWPRVKFPMIIVQLQLALWQSTSVRLSLSARSKKEDYETFSLSLSLLAERNVN